MKNNKLLLTSFAAAALVGLATLNAHSQTLPPVEISPGGPSYAAGEILVQFKPDVTDAQMVTAFQQGRLGLIKHIHTPAMQDRAQIGLTRAATAMPVPVAVRLLNSLPGVEFAEPNWLVTADNESNDPYYWDTSLPGPLWGMYGDDTPSPIGPVGTTNPFGSQAEKAWAAGFIGSRDICVGIIDTGFQPDHLDLAANVWTNPGEIPGNGIDDDGNGYVDDAHGWNAIANNGVIYDPGYDVHGTHVAGTVGAVGGNGTGVAGVNWDVTLISGKFLGRDGSGWTSDALEAIDYMTALKTRKGLNIVALNNSWGGGGFSQALLDAITRAANAGILFLAAAGNAATNTDLSPFYPAVYNTTASAGYDAVISVAAINRQGGKSSFSNYGQTTVDLGAPGGERANLNDSTVRDPNVEIVSTVPPNTYGHLRGTSMATPHVTGAVALHGSVNPGATASQTRNDLLTAGVRPLAALEGITVTGGTLDVGRLMERAPIALDAPVAPANLQATVISAARVDLSWADQSANELGFALERSSDNGQTYVLADTVGANLTTYSDRTALPGSTYWYRVRAYNPGGSSTYTATVSVTTPLVYPPNAPSSLTAKAQSPGKGVALAWKDNANNEDGFQIERKTGSTGTWQLLATPPANTTQFTDTATVRRTTYVYRVRAFNAAGGSLYSNQVSVTTK